jgi:hypothetical protein
MRNQRFKAWLIDELRRLDDPRISNVEEYEFQFVTNPVIRCSDGSAIHLMIVNTSPPGGDNHAEQEKVIERKPETPIVVSDSVLK